MENLKRITRMDMIKVPRFTLDNFQQGVLGNLYLEFFLESCRVIITPEFGFLTTGSVTETEEEEIADILSGSRSDLLDKLKQYILYNLSLYSSLLETNSYYITLNQNLLIARFVSIKGSSDKFEIKLYTLSRSDLPARYTDKLYLGRDYVSLTTLRRDHFGIKYIRNSTIDQFLKLKERLNNLIEPAEVAEMNHEYLQELEELVGEFAESTGNIIESFPVDISSHTMEKEALIQANMHFRDTKHILIELLESVRELEKVMFERNHIRAARYVTKLKKDITNNVNYILIKVNGRISDAVNGIHL